MDFSFEKPSLLLRENQILQKSDLALVQGSERAPSTDPGQISTGFSLGEDSGAEVQFSHME